MVVVQPEGSIVVRAVDSDDIDIAVDVSGGSTLVSSESSSEVTIDDAIFDRHADSVSESKYTFEVSIISDALNVSSLLRVYTSDDDVAVIENDSVVYVADGSCSLIVSVPGLVKSVPLDFLQEGGDTTDVFNRYAVGVLGKSVTDAMVTQAATGTKPLFSAVSHGTSTYTRNVSCWINADFTGRPVWVSSKNSGGFCGALISPCHLLIAAHANISGTVRFVTQDNVVHTRSITAGTTIGQDIRILKLDSDVPGSIKHYKLLPANYLDYVQTFELPVVATDKDYNVLARRWYSPGTSGPPAGLMLITSVYANGDFTSLSEPIVAGDSGSASFLLLNGELVLLGTHYSADQSGNASNYIPSNYITEINAAMTSLGGGYSVETVDLSAFTDFS